MAQDLKTKSTPRDWCLLMHFDVSLMYLWSTSEPVLITFEDISDDLLMTSDNS